MRTNGQATKLRSDNTRGLRGVFAVSRPFKSEIANNGRRHFLGTYLTKFEAAFAYNVAAVLIHGPYAITNPSPDETQLAPERAEQIRNDVTKRLAAVNTPSSEPKLDPVLVG